MDHSAGDVGSAETERLPNSSFAVLGMLTFGEASGYDLVKLAERSLEFFWAPAKSQIYSELRRLVAAGLATEREVEQADRPDKRLYRITPAGERALRRWLEERPEHEPFKSEFLLKLFFGHQMSRERLLALVEGHRRDSQEALERLREIGAQIDGDPRFRSARLTLEYGIAHFRANVSWCDRALRTLKGGEG